MSCPDSTGPFFLTFGTAVKRDASCLSEDTETSCSHTNKKAKLEPEFTGDEFLVDLPDDDPCVDDLADTNDSSKPADELVDTEQWSSQDTLTTAFDSEFGDALENFGSQPGEVDQAKDGFSHPFPTIVNPVLYRTDSNHSNISTHSTVSTGSIAEQIAYEATSAEYMPPFLRNIFGMDVTLTNQPQHPAQMLHGMRASQQHCTQTVGTINPADIYATSSVTKKAKPTKTRISRKKLVTPRAESPLGQDKEYVCNFKTTNVELYRWHTAQLKVVKQKTLAQARAAAAYAEGSSKKMINANSGGGTELEGSSAPASGLPSIGSADVTDTTLRLDNYPFVPDPDIPAELGLLRDPFSGRLVLACPAAFDVKARIDRHLSGKCPMQWAGGAGEPEYIFTAGCGTVYGQLGVKGAWASPVKDIAIHKKPKARKLFSFEKKTFTCSWPVCGKEFGKIAELQDHMVDLHQIPLPAVFTKDTCKYLDAFKAAPVDDTQSCDWISVARKAVRGSSAMHMLEHFCKAVRKSMKDKLQDHVRVMGPIEYYTQNVGAMLAEDGDGVGDSLLRAADMEKKLDQFIDELNTDIVGREIGAWFVGRENMKPLRQPKRATHFKSPNTKLKNQAREFAAVTRPTKIALFYAIDSRQIPFPTVDELMNEFKDVLDSVVASGCELEVPITNTDHFGDMVYFQDAVEQWSAEHLADKAVEFVVGMRDAEVKRLGLTVVKSMTLGTSSGAPCKDGKRACNAAASCDDENAASEAIETSISSRVGLNENSLSTPTARGLRKKRNTGRKRRGKENVPPNGSVDKTPAATPTSRAKSTKRRNNDETLSRVIAAAAKERTKAGLPLESFPNSESQVDLTLLESPPKMSVLHEHSSQVHASTQSEKLESAIIHPEKTDTFLHPFSQYADFQPAAVEFTPMPQRPGPSHALPTPDNTPIDAATPAAPNQIRQERPCPVLDTPCDTQTRLGPLMEVWSPAGTPSDWNAEMSRSDLDGKRGLYSRFKWK